MDDKFFQQKDCMAMGSSLLPIVSNIFMEHFEKFALDSAQHKPSVWLRYVDDTFVVWPHGPSRLQDFLNHLNSLRPSIQFTMEIESDSAIAFLDVQDIRRETTLATKVYRKPTPTGRYLNFSSKHPPHVKRRLIQSLHSRASTICQERQDLVKEISSLRSDLQLNGYPQGFIDSEKFRRIGNRYIRTIFRTRHSLRSSLMKTRPERDQLQTAQCIYSIPCESGRSYIGETGRPLAVRLREHRHNLQQGLLEKSKFAQHAYEEAGMMLRFWKLKVTVGIGNIRNRLTWHV
jgi:hypothetical protein